MKRITALLLVTAMILTLFAGCGSNNQPQATAAAANNPTMEVGSAAEVDVVAKGDGTAEHVIRDSVTVGVQSDPADFAPWAANSNGRTNALWGLYQELGHIISAVNSTAVAIVLGSIAGYFGGWVDNLIMRICDVLQSIPGMLLSIIISATLGVGFVNTVIALSVGGIAGGIRMLRGQILGIRKEEYLEAAMTVNCSPARIMFRHILPNALSATIVGVTMGMGNTIMVAASLSYIGLGVQPPDPEWGAMLSSGRDVFRKYPHIMLFPGVFIFITVLCFNLFGDGLRDAMDPKLKR